MVRIETKAMRRQPTTGTKSYLNWITRLNFSTNARLSPWCHDEVKDWVTFLEQHCGGVAGDIVLQVSAPCQAVGHGPRALLPSVKVALSPAVKPKSAREEHTHVS